MKIGIITFQRSVNYGALMQAWSLSTLLNAHGTQVEVIDYQPAHRHGKLLRLSRRRPLSRGNLMALRMYWIFRKYIHNKLPLSAKQFQTYRELECARCDYDVIVLGSDQIWNPIHNGGLDPAYFAWFAPDRVRRVAYAASIGMEKMPAPFVEQYSKYLAKLDHISLREGSAAAFTADLIGKPCHNVLDPTLLGLDFTPLEELVAAPSRYVLGFPLQLSTTIQLAIRIAADAMDLPSLTVKTTPGKHDYADHSLTPNPGQWLSLLKGADMVITNSFHGVAFCLNYQRPFAVVPIEGEGLCKMARIIDLLGQLGLSHHILPVGEAYAVNELVGRPIDWEEVSLRLRRLRAASLTYLAEALDMPALAQG
jgi:hypothetical protein